MIVVDKAPNISLIGLSAYKKKAIKIAKDLCYSKECMNSIEKATNEIQVDQALKKERKKK